MADTSDAPAPTVSYAKIVDPAKENGAKTVPAPEQSPPDQEQVIKKTVVSEDDEGFQPVTDKKKEKQKEKELLREKEYRKNRKGGKSRKSKFKEKDREKYRERENDKENNYEKPDSKETSPPESVKTEADKEFVPAPLPKNNPWKKPSSNKSDMNAESVGDKQKPKTERKKKNSERDSKEHTAPVKSHHHHSRGNPWKKVEVSVEDVEDPGLPSSPKVTRVERKEGGASWPKPGEEKPPVKGKRVKSGDSADSGAASSLETEEGKEVRPMSPGVQGD